MSKRDSLSDIVFRALKADIIRCKYAPGDIIVENDLAAQYNVSRTPVRESLGRLEQDGFVQATQRRGYIITPITLKDVREVFTLRVVLEGKATALATTRIPVEFFDKLDNLHANIYTNELSSSDALSEKQRYIEANFEFHNVIAEASGNSRLAKIIRGLLEEANRFIYIQTSIVGTKGVEEASRLVQAMRSRNEELASHLMQAHILETYNRIIEVIISGDDGFRIDEGIG